MVLAGCANDDNPSAVHAKDLGTQSGEVLVPYEPVVVRKITQDPSQFPMPAPASEADAEVPAEAPTEAPAGAETPAAETPAETPADAAPTAAPDMASLPPSPEGVQMAAVLMEELSTGRHKDIEARFSPELKKLVPEDTLKIQWNLASEQLGSYQSIQTSAGRKVPKDGQTYDYAEAVLQFERGTAVLMVAFDSQKQIVQLSIVPGQATQRGAETPAPAGEAPAAPSESGRGSANMDIIPPTAPTGTLGF
jgi:hypothetical protein